MIAGSWKSAARRRIAKDEAVQEALKIEPRLQSVLDTVLAIQPRMQGYCRHKTYGHLKNRLALLVGWYASRPEVRTQYHYVAAVQLVYDILPDDMRDGAFADTEARLN